MYTLVFIELWTYRIDVISCQSNSQGRPHQIICSHSFPSQGTCILLRTTSETFELPYLNCDPGGIWPSWQLEWDIRGRLYDSVRHKDVLETSSC